MNNISNIKFVFENNALKFKNPILKETNIVYLPYNEMLEKIKSLANGKKINTTLLYFKTIISDNTKKIGNIVYIELSYLCVLLNIKTIWNYKTKTIYLFMSKDETIKNTDNFKRKALIRLEDITSGNSYESHESLEKLRVIGDFLFGLNIPFHIAWIPRYVNPDRNIDNDISKNSSFYNADFLFTLKYLAGRGGIVGLHGYTHQFGAEISGEGSEFNSNRNNDEKSIKQRIDAAKAIAKNVGVSYSFFETPHYEATALQQKNFEKHFNIIYEPCVHKYSEKVVKSPWNKKTLYIPTPLGYVDEKGIDDMILRIKTLKDTTLASLFFHPYMEFEYVNKLSKNNNYPAYDYSINSPLNKIINAIINKNCKFSRIIELNKKN